MDTDALASTLVSVDLAMSQQGIGIAMLRQHAQAQNAVLDLLVRNTEDPQVQAALPPNQGNIVDRMA